MLSSKTWNRSNRGRYTWNIKNNVTTLKLPRFLHKIASLARNLRNKRKESRARFGYRFSVFVRVGALLIDFGDRGQALVEGQNFFSTKMGMSGSKCRPKGGSIGGLLQFRKQRTESCKFIVILSEGQPRCLLASRFCLGISRLSTRCIKCKFKFPDGKNSGTTNLRGERRNASNLNENRCVENVSYNLKNSLVD